VIVVFTVPMLDKLKIDDVVGAIPVHLFAGIWGTIAVVLTNGDASIGGQLISIVIVGVFVFVVSLVVWFILKAVMGIRVSEEDEFMGLDKAELGMEAYPEFTKGFTLTLERWMLVAAGVAALVLVLVALD
jgi:Amt family ammonium transporter